MDMANGFETLHAKEQMKAPDPHMVAFLGALKNSVDSVPKEYKTNRELCLLWNRSCSRVCKMLNQSLAQGTMEAKVFRIKTPAGVRSVPHYRPTAKQSP
jgi:hypothetical protein